MGFIRILKDDLVCLKVVLNGSSSSEYGLQLVEAIAGLYRPLSARLSLSRKGIYLESKDYISWETELKNGQISCYLICPKRLAEFLKFKIHCVWENATIERVNMPTNIDAGKAVGCELRYKRNDIFSLNIDNKTGTAEMALRIAQGLTFADRAIVQVVFDPINQQWWKNRACQMYRRFLRGTMTMPSQLEKMLVGRCPFGSIIGEMVQLVFKASGCQSVSDNSRAYVPNAESRLLLLRKAVDPAKPESTAVRTFVRIVAESPDRTRAARTVNAIVVAYKQLNGDNEFRRSDKSSFKQNFVKDINLRRPSLFRLNGNIMSAKECTKLMDLN